MPEAPPLPLEALPGSTMYIYKQVEGIDLPLHVFNPPGHEPSRDRPAIVFFFGGGWVGGRPAQFSPQCQYLASRGMVAISAEYRVRTRHGVTPYECVRDARSAMRWVRGHVRDLGIDPDRLAAGGGSAGGHLAATTAAARECDDPADDASVSCMPAAMILFNPVLDTVVESWQHKGHNEMVQRLLEKIGPQGHTISPTHNVRPGLPPTCIFHGEDDVTVPFRHIQDFAAAMRQAGNRCDVHGFPGRGHGFFNHARGDGADFHRTMRLADEFLASLGWLQGEPTIDAFTAQVTG